MTKIRVKNIFLGVTAIFGFFVLSTLRESIINDLRTFGVNNTIVNFISIMAVLAIIGFCFLLFQEKLIADFKDLKKNHQLYFKKYLVYWLVALGLMMVVNLILYFGVNDGIAENEEAIRNLFAISPVYVYVSAVLLAPVIEELVFRGGFYYIFKNKYLFVFFSGISFGLIHVIGATSLNQFLYIIPYSIPGFVFALALYNSKNLYVPIGLHFLHNGVIMALQTFVVIFGGDLVL